MKGMTIGEVLKLFPELDANTLYYWESIGFIKPKKVRKKSIDRRIYRQRDLEKIELAYKYYQQGLPPKVCRERAEAEARQSVDDLDSKLKNLSDKLENAGISLEGMSLSNYISLTIKSRSKGAKLELIKGIESVLQSHEIKKREDLKE